ncbi:MAG: PilZ domain-containing protein [bacterium]|nr:PilZ domain-containing protein [bacterium]MCP5070577.1 PilZ domain-containing protein [bacterium]
MDKRRSPRFRTRFDALVSSEDNEGAGILTEISYAGARLENVDKVPALGTKVTLYVFIQPVAPFQLRGNVTRVGDAFFAMAWEPFDEEMQRLVDDVGAIVSGPASGA